MVLLEALNLSALTPGVLEFLAGQQVFTVEDFLLHDVHALATIAEQSLVSAEFKQAVTEVLSYLEKLQDGWSMGSEIFEEGGQFLPISCESVDSLLDGGLQEGTITELVGPSSTGKSQVCMQAAASVAYRFQSAVVFVDTNNSFCARRVGQILDSFLGCNQARIKEEEQGCVGHVMEGIHRIAILDVFSLLSFLDSLQRSLQSNSAMGQKLSPLRLLVVDSASSVISPILGGKHGRGHALMIGLARCLNKLAIVNRVAILITNHTVIGDEGRAKPALGESWTSVPHTRLWLDRDLYSDAYTISLTKHSSLPCCKQAAFTIGTGGLKSFYDVRKVCIPSSPSF